MVNFEWGGDLKQKGKVVHIDDKRDERNGYDQRYQSELKVAGDTDFRHRWLAKNVKFNSNFRRATLTKEGGAMSETNDDRYNQLKEDLRDSERRISSGISEREERFERELAAREDRFEKSMEKYAQEAKEREERYMKSVEEIKKTVEEGNKNRTSNTIAMWTLAITTLLGIAAMVVTVAVSS